MNVMDYVTLTMNVSTKQCDIKNPLLFFFETCTNHVYVKKKGVYKR